MRVVADFVVAEVKNSAKAFWRGGLVQAAFVWVGRMRRIRESRDDIGVVLIMAVLEMPELWLGCKRCIR